LKVEAYRLGQCVMYQSGNGISFWIGLDVLEVGCTLAPSGAGNGNRSITHMADSLYSSLSHNARAVDKPKTPDPMIKINAGIFLSDASGTILNCQIRQEEDYDLTEPVCS